MQCGPASQKSIKEGDVFLGYDAGFIYAEVNGTIVHWKENDSEEFEITKVDRRHVGTKISTKAVGKNEREVITDQYKYPEGIAAF